jgi:hypothetical protein
VQGIRYRVIRHRALAGGEYSDAVPEAARGEEAKATAFEAGAALDGETAPGTPH